jgi:hypothetical protein
MPVSSEFLELMGEYKAAAREVGRELKDLTREAKDAAKAGGSLSAEKQGRLAYLESRRDSLNDRYQQQKNIDDAIKSSLSRQVDTARGKLADVMRIASGRVTARDIEALGAGARRVGASVFAGAAPGSATAAVGARMMQAGGAIAGTAAKFAGPAALVAAAGYGVYHTMNSMYDSQTAEAKSRGHTSDALNALAFEERHADRITGQDLTTIRSRQASSSREIRELGRGSEILGSLKEMIGFGPSDRTLTLEQKTAGNEQRRALMAKRFGPEFEKGTSIEEIKKSRAKELDRVMHGPAERMLRGIPGVGAVASLGHALYDTLTGTDERAMKAREYLTEVQGKIMDSKEQQLAVEQLLVTTTSEYRVEEQARNRQLRAVEEDRLRRRLQWNQW